MAQDKIDDTRLCAIVRDLVAEAEKYRDELSVDREKAMAYFDGDEKDLAGEIPADEGRSHVVSRDVRAAVRKVLPSVMRTILGNDEVVEYVPVGEGDEDSAQQATDYVNYVTLPECNGRQVIEDAINDALRLRNGIIKWWQEEKIEVSYSDYSGLTEDAMAQLVQGDDVDVLEHSQREVMVEAPEGSFAVPVHDLRIRRRLTRSKPRIAALPPENFLIHPDATRIEDSPIVGDSCRLRRSELVAMGYDRDLIDTIPAAGAGAIEQESERQQRRRLDDSTGGAEAAHAMQEVEYYDLLVRVDQDDDGIAELRRIIFAGAIKPEYMLENTEWDEVNYADVVCERRPHQWEGNSVTDEVMDIQKIKTVLLRQTLDNLYWQNNPQPTVQEGMIENMDAVLRPEFGKPIRVRQGVDVRAALGFNQVPMVADKSFAMLEYMNGEAADRTGINEASSGMAPDALQNMTAKATSLIEAAGIGQTEMMVRAIAESLAPVFRGLLRLIVKHQDAPRTVRLRKKWVTFDPRQWNAHMDAIVNIGLGAGTRERDMMMMQQVIGLQRELLSAFGPVNPFVKPEQLYNAIAKLVEAAGLRSVGLYFTEPDPQEVQKLLKAQANKPTPEQERAQAQLQVEQARIQGRMQIEQVKAQARIEEFSAKMQADASKEEAQMNADLITKLQEIEAQAKARMQEAMLRASTDHERHEVDLEREAMRQQTEREWMATQAGIAAEKIAADVQKSQAEQIGRAIDRARTPDGNRVGRQGR